MSIISMVLVVVVAFLAGLEGILDQFQFHQPLVACTLIGLVTGNLTAGIMLGGSLQFIALGWANIGAAVAPDAALASVAAAIIMVPVSYTHLYDGSFGGYRRSSLLVYSTSYPWCPWCITGCVW